MKYENASKVFGAPEQVLKQATNRVECEFSGAEKAKKV